MTTGSVFVAPRQKFSSDQIDKIINGLTSPAVLNELQKLAGLKRLGTQGEAYNTWVNPKDEYNETPPNKYLHNIDGFDFSLSKNDRNDQLFNIHITPTGGQSNEQSKIEVSCDRDYNLFNR